LILNMSRWKNLFIIISKPVFSKKTPFDKSFVSI